MAHEHYMSFLVEELQNDRLEELVFACFQNSPKKWSLIWIPENGSPWTTLESKPDSVRPVSDALDCAKKINSQAAGGILGIDQITKEWFADQTILPHRLSIERRSALYLGGPVRISLRWDVKYFPEDLVKRTSYEGVPRVSLDAPAERQRIENLLLKFGTTVCSILGHARGWFDFADTYNPPARAIHYVDWVPKRILDLIGGVETFRRLGIEPAETLDDGGVRLQAVRDILGVVPLENKPNPNWKELQGLLSAY